MYHAILSQVALENNYYKLHPLSRPKKSREIFILPWKTEAHIIKVCRYLLAFYPHKMIFMYLYLYVCPESSLSDDNIPLYYKMHLSIH